MLLARAVSQPASICTAEYSISKNRDGFGCSTVLLCDAGFAGSNMTCM